VVTSSSTVELDLRKASRCNCTLCTKLGVTGSMVKPAAFALRSPVTSLSTFTRTPEVATRYFCARCHVYCYGQGHLAELGGDFVSINLGCIDGFDPTAAEFVHWTAATTTGPPDRARRRGRCRPHPSLPAERGGPGQNHRSRTQRPSRGRSSNAFKPSK
jgi:hypothetical protein